MKRTVLIYCVCSFAFLACHNQDDGSFPLVELFDINFLQPTNDAVLSLSDETIVVIWTEVDLADYYQLCWSDNSLFENVSCIETTELSIAIPTSSFVTGENYIRVSPIADGIAGSDIIRFFLE